MMKRLAHGLLRGIGAALYKVFVATLTVAFIGGGIAALANYNFTQGSGTAFGSIVVSAVHYAQMLLCDPTTPSQCTAVSAGGAAKVDGSAVTQPVSGTVTANAGTNLNTSTLSTSANQTNASQKTQVVDGSGNVVTTQSANSHVAPDVVINDASGNRLSGLTTGTAGSASTQVLSVQGIASMTKLLVTPDSVALPANQSVNLNQVAGSTLGAITTYGTSPGAVNVASVNAFVTNANANGPASAANSSPVVLGISGNSASAATGVTCGSAVSSCILKNAAGNFYGVYAECTSACWLMVFNSASAPSNGATTAGTASGNMVECVDIAANSSRSITYPVFPTNYSVGVTAVISSTACATLTLSTVGFIRGTVL